MVMVYKAQEVFQLLVSVDIGYDMIAIIVAGSGDIPAAEIT